jgi:alpha-galactosidase
MRVRPTILHFTFLTLTLTGAHSAAAATVASAGDAAIAHDQGAGTWSLSAAGTTLTLALDPARDFSVAKLVTASGKAWISTSAADSVVTLGQQTLPFVSRGAGFTYQGVTVEAAGNTLQLNATFDLASAGLRVVRHYVVVSGSPTFEVWTTYAPTAGSPSVSNLSALQMTIPAGAVHWLTGLQGDNADVEHDSAFTLQQKTLAAGEHFEIGATGRSSEQTVPWIAIDGTKDEFYAALMWSGAWTLTADLAGSNIALALGLAPMKTTLTALNGPVDGPHVVFGVAVGGLPQASAALRSYVLDGIRGGRPLAPQVTYNTWFAYGTEIDEASMLAEMDQAAAIGAEMFVVDAGWYEGTGAAGPFDFDSGLGTWTPDPVRFPNGLAPLRDHAHGLGIKFGLWVEPERVNLSLVGPPGVEEQWLATSGGSYGSDHAGQICLANTAARQWILSWMTSLIDEVQPDYLKWDNNMWLNCDRSGHEHGATDGNFAHVNGLYDILSTLRAQYPDLLIENVSGGGNRLDLGMVRYTDVAWMDDRTAPSVHVRHNIEGLSAVFPPAYLLSFVTDHETEPLHDAPDLSLYVRSRMAAALGLCFKSSELSEGDSASMAHEIDIYKSVRDTLSQAAGSLLTGQAEAQDGPPWDVLQESSAGGQQILLHAFQTDDGTDRFNIKPTGLAATTTYEVVSVDTGVLGTATGADLMSNGIDVLQSPNSAAHILIVTVKEP